METPGEDSGFGYEDPLNLLEDASANLSVNYQSPDESDEGIFIPPNQQPNNQQQPDQLFDANADAAFGVENFIQNFGEENIIPPHIQLQMAQAEYGQGQAQNFDDQLLQQNPFENLGAQNLVNGDDDLGDDNNNDRADDVNNNTTDPDMLNAQNMLRQQRYQQLHAHAAYAEGLMRGEGAGPPLASDDEEQEPLGIPDSEEEDEVVEEFSQVSSSSQKPDIKPVVEKDVEIIANGDSNKDKRKKKKKKKKHRFVADVVVKDEPGTNENDEPEVEVEYVPEKLELSVFDPLYRAFANVFENFRITDPKKMQAMAENPLLNLKKVPKIDFEEDLEQDKKDDDKPKLSKRKLKQLTRLSVAELKQVVARPDVVEMHDVTAKDPKLLVHLKAYRNTVPVPRHWCYKRKYLQGKRGFEKPPFDLPLFIKKTGIMEMREALAEKEDQKSLKTKMRERVRPKMGKIDIDYQKLHDAFFKWQTKPKMTIHGDLYYEGKEFETRMKDKKPGDLSDDLRTSLGMPIGPNANKVPPPWLIAMQRYGPPPSYPHLKIPGLNAPIPDGCSFGYHAGGWGKPPVDEFGRPLYGDVFGTTGGDEAGAAEEEYIEKGLWGELESEEEESSSEEEEEDEDKEDEEETETPDESGLQTPAEGLATPSGFSSVPAGLETPESIELRKKRIEQDMEGGDTPALYTVLPEKRVDKIAGAMMASTHVYDIGASKDRSKPFGSKDSSAVELALDPSELDMVDTAAMEARYEQTLKEKQAYGHGEDLSDMVAEHTAKQKNKRKRQMQQQDTKKGAKKQKEFKF